MHGHLINVFVMISGGALRASVLGSGCLWGEEPPCTDASEHCNQWVLGDPPQVDPNSAGSQFFVVTAEHADFLDGQYTLFGNLVDGDDVLDAIADTPVDFGPGGERSQPTERVAIERVEFLIVEPEASDDDGGKQKPKPGEGADEAADGEGDADAPAGGEGDS